MVYKKSEKASVENPVVAIARRLGVLVLKVNPLWAAGWPDRIFFVPGGRPLIIEFKRPGGKTTPLQDKVINDLRSLGYDVEVIDSKEQGEAILRARLAAHGVPKARG